MTSISKSPVRWRSEGRALALKERGSPSEAFRKPVITDPTYIKRCRQPPATSHQPARSVSSVSLFAFFSPSSLSSSSLYLCRPVRTSFFLSNLFILLWCTFTRSFFRFLFSFVFSFVLSVHFERPPASTPTAVHLIWPFPPLYASKGLSDSSFILSSYFTYSQFLSFLSSISSSSSLSFYPLLLALSLLFHILDCSVGNRGLLLGIVRKTDYNRKKERVEREEETMSNIFHSSSFFFFLLLLSLISLRYKFVYRNLSGFLYILLHILWALLQNFSYFIDNVNIDEIRYMYIFNILFRSFFMQIWSYLYILEIHFMIDISVV